MATHLLIGVTECFRDPDAFQALVKTVIPEILRERNPDAPIRIWVPGCASGEEPYSLAMLFAEAARLTGQPLAWACASRRASGLTATGSVTARSSGRSLAESE